MSSQTCSPSFSDDLPTLSLCLQRWLVKHWRSSARLLNLQRSAGGYSNITLLAELQTDEGTQGIVIRIQPEGASVFPDCDVQTQYRTLTLLQGSGLPVPALLGLELDSSVIGAPFFLMARIEGRVPNENPPYHLEGWFHDLAPQPMRQHWFAGVDGFAALAKLDWRALGFSFLLPQQGQSPLVQLLDYYERMLGWSESLSGRSYPLLWRAMDWLQLHQPQDEPMALSWGDAKLGNCVFDSDGRLVGMLDWERPALANPVDDLAWWLMLDESMCTGYGLPRLAGLPEKAETIARWEQVSGCSATDLPYYELLAAWRFAIVMSRIGDIFTKRGWVAPDARMDERNGGSRLLELHAERLNF